MPWIISSENLGSSLLTDSREHQARERRQGAYDGAQLAMSSTVPISVRLSGPTRPIRSKKNKERLGKNGYVSDIEKTKGRPMSEVTSRPNGWRSKPARSPKTSSRSRNPSGPVRPHHRRRLRQDEDRHGQPCLQSRPLRLA